MLKNSPPVIELEEVSVFYGKHKALQEISGTFYAGSLTAVAGPNGAGKSTLLKVMTGAIKPTRGKVKVCGKCAKSMAYLPQITAIRRGFPINVLQAVCTGFWQREGGFGLISSEHKNRARSALAEVGLEGLEKRQIGSLSGGQFQRLLFARLILQNADIILLDEPFAGVDSETTAKLIQILVKWHKEGRTIICVLHDLLLIRKYFPETFVLAGRCLGKGHTHALFEQKLLSFDLDMAELTAPEDKEGTRRHRHDAV